MSSFRFHSSNLQDTDRLGHALAECIAPGTTLALCGTLGAGKTYLVQSLAEALGIPRKSVVSPTFSLIQTYPGRTNLVHIDTYRIVDDDEFAELGIEELLESANSVVAMEWADRFRHLLPSSFLNIQIDLDRNGGRVFLVEPVGPDAKLGQACECITHRLA